jgi:putative transposase
MKLYKTYKYKLKLTKVQANTIDNWIGTCRFVYNLALETKITAYQKGVKLTKYDLRKQMTGLRDIDWIQAVPSTAITHVGERLEKAYQVFFKGGGFPKWAKKGLYNSITFSNDHQYLKQTEKGFVIPKIREVKVFNNRKINGDIKIATIKKENNAYYISVDFECESENLYPTDENQAVGLDMGITYFLTDSNGCFVENPRHNKKYEARLRVKHRAFSRKKKGSNGFKRAKSELNRLYSKVANVRKDFSHKVSLRYIKENSLIVCEDLKVDNMAKSVSLSKHIADVSWAAFFSKLRYKCQFYEKTFVQVDPKYTSQTCHSCGHVAKENRLNQANFQCVSCGYQQNADYNAAQNILGRGMALVR